MDTTLVKKAAEAVNEINTVVLGKEEKVETIMLAMLADGHILLEDMPGVGKTTLALAFSKTLGIKCNRVQFTPDLMPSDLTGFSIYRREEERFVYQEGSIFCNLLLADELNRTSPKTQSALLEVMEEGKVSIEGMTREVPKPFLVIATQNPYGSAGTGRIPESQVDRFMISMTLGYPDFESEVKMASRVGAINQLEELKQIVLKEELLLMQKDIKDIYMDEVIYNYIVRLIGETRTHPYVAVGGSPRATIALVKMAKARGWLHNRGYVLPHDVKECFPYIMNHRLELKSNAKASQIKKEDIIRELLLNIKEPALGEE